MKRMMKTMLWLGCSCFVITLLMAVSPAQAAKERKEIVIGTHLSLSGVQAAVVIHQKWAYERAVRQVNEAGGLFVKEYNKKLPIRLIEVDDESDPTHAAAAVERLVKRDKVDMILSGQTGALATLPGMVTAEKYKIYYQGCVIWPEQFKEQHFKWPTMYFFEPFIGAEMTFDLWQSLPENERPKKPAVISEDTFDGKTIGDGWEMVGKKLGYTFAPRGAMRIGANDFTSQVLQAKDAGVDAVLCLADTPQIVTLLRQSKENNFNFKWFQGLKGTWSPDFYKAMGKDGDYILCDGFWSMDYPFKGVRDSAKELGEAWYKEFGNYSVTTGLFYANANILFQAIEKAGTLDGAKIRQAVLANTFETVMGPVKYDELGIALFDAANFQWWDGKQQLIFPIDRATWEAKPMPPWDKR